MPFILVFNKDPWSTLCYCCLDAQPCLPLRSHGLSPARFLCPWDFPGKNTGVGCHFLLQGIFPAQEWNPHLFHWQADSLPLSHLESPLYLPHLAHCATGFPLSRRCWSSKKLKTEPWISTLNSNSSAGWEGGTWLGLFPWEGIKWEAVLGGNSRWREQCV